MDSTNCPIVILDGNACGLIIISGRIPSRVKGISLSGIINPIVPFCPTRDANLSPIAGCRCSHIRTFAILSPSSPSVINVLSTTPNCPFLVDFDISILDDAFSVLLEVNPMITILSFITVPSRINPESSK